jgi:thioredoxin reductase
MKDRQLVIVGGGLAGLAAGCHALAADEGRPFRAAGRRT